MRFMIPLLTVFSFILLTGCASTTKATTEPVSTEAQSCTSCTDGTTKHACSSCTSGKDCNDCTKSKDKTACMMCISTQACTDCAPKGDKVSEAISEPVVEAEPAAEVERVATIDAKGMSCPLCASNIDRRMQKVGGVNWTKIDLGTGQVIVGLEPGAPTPSVEALQQAVNDAGYTAGAVTLPGDEVTP